MQGHHQTKGMPRSVEAGAPRHDAPQPLAQALAYCSSPLYVSLVCELAGRAPCLLAASGNAAAVTKYLEVGPQTKWP
jgi:hypothetical protein